MRGAAIAAALCAAAALGQSSEPPYRRIQVPGRDVCIAWSNRDIVYSPDAAGSSQTPGDTEFAAIDAAWQTWQAASDRCSDFRFIRGDRIPNAVFGYDRSSQTNHNIIIFREVACRDVVPENDPCFADGSCANAYRCWDNGDYTIALTVTTFTSRSGTILDADVQLNAAPHLSGSPFLFTTVSSPPCLDGLESVDCVATDVQNTLTHEFGHALGLDHVAIPGSTLEATAPLGETRKRILDYGSQQGLCAIYPRGLPASDCFQTGPISPHVEAMNRGIPGIGCNAAPGVPCAAVALWAVAAARRRRGLRSAARAGAAGAASDRG